MSSSLLVASVFLQRRWQYGCLTEVLIFQISLDQPIKPWLLEDVSNGGLTLEAMRYQKGIRLDPEPSGLKKAYFGLKIFIKKTKFAISNTAYHVHLAYQKALGLASEHFRPSLLSCCCAF
ncbi:hypothetical protein AMTRI_Chr08g206000 [Amborella trichopoda]